jgi:hypothetical protein
MLVERSDIQHNNQQWHQHQHQQQQQVVVFTDDDGMRAMLAHHFGNGDCGKPVTISTYGQCDGRWNILFIILFFFILLIIFTIIFYFIDIFYYNILFY